MVAKVFAFLAAVLMLVCAIMSALMSVISFQGTHYSMSAVFAAFCLVFVIGFGAWTVRL